MPLVQLSGPTAEKTVCISKHQFITALLKCMSMAEIIHLSHKVPEKNFKLRLKKKNGNVIDFDGKYFPDMTDDFVISIKASHFYTDVFIPNGWFYIWSICDNAKSDKKGAHGGVTLGSGSPANNIFNMKK